MTEFADDRALAAAVTRGKRGAAETLFDRIFDGLYRRVLVRLEGDQDAAEDVVSASLLSGLRALGSYRGEATLETWFFRIALRKIADRFRSRAVRWIEAGDGRLEEALAGRSNGDPPAVERLVRDELRARVHEALDSLPERYRSVLRWRYLDESTVADLARRLGVSAKAAERRLARARAALATVLRGRGLE